MLPYTHCYCEENTYKTLEIALQDEHKELFDVCFAVFVSSFGVQEGKEVKNTWEDSRVPYRYAKTEPPMIWDYHVFAVLKRRNSTQHYVIDQDSKCKKIKNKALGDWIPYCMDLKSYLDYTFSPDPNVPLSALMLRMIRFRVMTAEDYLGWFRSDRSHMLASSTPFAAPSYHKPPPSYSPIQNFHPTTSEETKEAFQRVLDLHRYTFYSGDGGNNLVCFINMKNKSFPGKIANLEEVVSCITSYTAT